MDDQAGFHDLLNIWLTGAASDSELAELSAMVARDPALAAEVRRQHQQHLHLVAVLAAPSATLVAQRARAVVASQRPSSVQRIVSGVRRSRTRRPRRPWPLMMGMAAAALLMLGIGLWFAGPRDPRLGPVSEGVVTWADGTRIELVPGSRAEVTAADSGAQVTLHAGHLAAAVAHQVEGRHFAIRTPHGLVEVVGTRFTLAVDESTRLAVQEGSVRLRAPDDTVMMVAAGNQARLPVVQPAAGPVRRDSLRVIDDFEGVFSWQNIWASEGFEFLVSTDAAASGIASLRMSYDESLVGQVGHRYRYLIHPLRLNADDRALRLSILVQAGADPSAVLFVHLKDEVSNNWMLLEDRPLTTFAAGWNTLTLPITPDLKPHLAEVGDGRYDLRRMTSLIVGIGYGSCMIHVDDVALVTTTTVAP